MERMLMQFKQRVLEVTDEVTMVASRADESCAMVSSCLRTERSEGSAIARVKWCFAVSRRSSG